MKSVPELIDQMNADVQRVQRLRARWTHLFWAACVLNGAAGVVIVSGRPPLIAIGLIVGSLGLLQYARRFPKQALAILRKYEDIGMP